jgi:hypothetical protein
MEHQSESEYQRYHEEIRPRETKSEGAAIEIDDYIKKLYEVTFLFNAIERDIE